MPAEPCGATAKSKAMPGHTHECVGVHSLGDHKCRHSSCRRWFWRESESTNREDWNEDPD